MSVNKTVTCDRCKEEISQDDGFSFTRQVVGLSRRDLCFVCHEKLKEYLIQQNAKWLLEEFELFETDSYKARMRIYTLRSFCNDT